MLLFARRLAPLALAVFPALCAATPWQPEAAAGGFSSYRLENGFRIILAPFPSAATTRVELLVKVGSKHEGYGETGMAHLLEHMLFKGAGERVDIKRELTALGATWNGTTNSDRTNYFETVRADPDKIDEAIRIEADRFLRPTFSADDLASEMTVVRNELERNDNNPASLVARALQRQSFFWHGYGRPTIGARSDIENAPFAALQAFHRRHYRPDNAALIVVGSFDAERVLALAGDLFGAATNPPEARPSTWTREDAERPRQRAELHRESGNTAATAGWLLPGGTDRQTQAIDLAMPALCADSWGSLRQTLVDQQGLALSVSCGVQDRPEYALLVATASGDKDRNPHELAVALREAVDRFAVTGIDAEQLERVRRNRLEQFDRVRRSVDASANRLSAAEVAGDWRLFFHQRDVFAELTLAEVNSALRHWVAGVAPAEALLHHGPPPRMPEPPVPADPRLLIGEREWPAPADVIDPLPQSLAELAEAVVPVALDEPSARAALLSRRTQNGEAWLVVANDFGDLDSLRGRRAACNFASSLFSEGSAELGRDRLMRELEALQASAGVNLTLGRISLQAPPDKLGAALELLLAVRRAPALPAAEFERRKASAIAALHAAENNPSQLAANAAALRFDNYPAGHPGRPSSIADNLAELRAVTLADVRGCVADFGGRSSLRIAVVGDLAEDDVRGFWASLRALPRSAIPYQRIAQPEAPTAVDTSDIVIAMPQRPNADILGQALLPLRNDAEDYPALALAVRLLGGDAASRLRLRLREQEGLAYSVGASLAASDFDPRARFSISASVASDQAERALHILGEEFTRAVAEGFSEREVEDGIRRWQEERRKLALAEPRYADRLASAMLTGRGAAWEHERDQAIARLRSAELNAAMRKYLGSAAFVWAIGKGE